MNGSRTYHGERVPGPIRIRVWSTDRTNGSLIERDLRHVPMHSPEGFEWGSGMAAGAADLALAILIDHLKEDVTRDDLLNGRSLAWHLHNPFKWQFVAGFKATWELSAAVIQAWLDQPDTTSRVQEWKRFWAEVARPEEARL